MTVDVVPAPGAGDPEAGEVHESAAQSVHELDDRVREAGPDERRSWMYAPPVMAMGAFVLVSLALMFIHFGAPLLNPILLSFFLVTLTLPIYRWLAKRNIKKGLVLAALLLGMIAVGVGLALLAWFSVNRLLDGLDTYSASIDARLQELGAYLQGLGLPIGSGTMQLTANAANQLLLSLLSGVANVAAQFGVAAVLAAFLLLEARRFGTLLRTSMRDLPYIGVIPLVMESAIQYFFIRIRLNIMTGLGFGTILWLLGVDYALLWAVLTVFLSFVPYIGLVLAATPAFLLAWAEFGLGRALIVVVAVILINLVIENVVAPTYTGKTLDLSPAVVFVSFFFWVWMLGPVGALLAMPITVLMMLTFTLYEPTRWLAQIIGGDEIVVADIPSA